MKHRSYPIAKGLFVSFLTFVLNACGSTYKCSDKRCQNRHDFDSLAAECLKIVERTARVNTFVVPADMDPHALTALQALRPIRTLAGGVTMDSVRLGSGEFLFRALRVDEPEAYCEGTAGPALRDASAVDLDKCGTTFLIPFALEEDHWASHSYKTVVCSADNRIVPKN